MKQCPVCKTTYTDDSLSFCLTDGAHLTAAPDANETARMNFGSNSIGENIPPDSVPTVFPPANAPVKSPPKSIKPVIIAAIIGLLLLFIAGIAGIGGYFLLKANDNQNSQIAEASPKPTPSPVSTQKNDETSELKEKLANLEKQVEDQKNQKNSSPSKETFPTPKQSGTTARVYAPGDGFLALRSDPDANLGYRITAIPHGATVNVTDCLSYSYIGKKRGRWCRAVYDGYGGWVFDAYLIY